MEGIELSLVPGVMRGSFGDDNMLWGFDEEGVTLFNIQDFITEEEDNECKEGKV